MNVIDVLLDQAIAAVQEMPQDKRLGFDSSGGGVDTYILGFILGGTSDPLEALAKLSRLRAAILAEKYPPKEEHRG